MSTHLQIVGVGFPKPVASKDAFADVELGVGRSCPERGHSLPTPRAAQSWVPEKEGRRVNSIETMIIIIIL